MNNKKGFTLIELLITFLIMSIILVIAIVSLIKIRNSKDKQMWEEVKEEVKAAAKSYFSSNKYLLDGSVCTDDSNCYAIVSVGTLVDKNYLNKVINPITKKAVDSCDMVLINNKNEAKYISTYDEADEVNKIKNDLGSCDSNRMLTLNTKTTARSPENMQTQPSCDDVRFIVKDGSGNNPTEGDNDWYITDKIVIEPVFLNSNITHYSYNSSTDINNMLSVESDPPSNHKITFNEGAVNASATINIYNSNASGGPVKCSTESYSIDKTPPACPKYTYTPSVTGGCVRSKNDDGYRCYKSTNYNGINGTTMTITVTPSSDTHHWDWYTNTGDYTWDANYPHFSNYKYWSTNNGTTPRYPTIEGMSVWFYVDDDGNTTTTSRRRGMTRVFDAAGNNRYCMTDTIWLKPAPAQTTTKKTTTKTTTVSEKTWDKHIFKWYNPVKHCDNKSAKTVAGNENRGLTEHTYPVLSNGTNPYIQYDILDYMCHCNRDKNGKISYTVEDQTSDSHPSGWAYVMYRTVAACNSKSTNKVRNVCLPDHTSNSKFNKHGIDWNTTGTIKEGWYTPTPGYVTGKSTKVKDVCKTVCNY